MSVTPQSHPTLPWKRLVNPAAQIDFPWIVFAVTEPRVANAQAHVYIYSERNGQTYDRPCAAATPGPGNPLGAARWALWFAQSHGG